MGFVAFMGHFLLGTSPLLVLYTFFVARKSFIVLLTIASSFFWLTVLLLISALFKGKNPGQTSVLFTGSSITLVKSCATRHSVCCVCVCVCFEAKLSHSVKHFCSVLKHNTLSDGIYASFGFTTGFTPIPNKAGNHAAAIIAAVLIEQVAKTLLYRVHKIITATLADVANKSGHILSPCDTLYVSLGLGFGHGASHSVFFFVSILPLLASHGTLYVDTCADMSYFLVSSLTTLGFGLLHTFSTIIFFDGLTEQKALRWSVPPVLHLLAALLTLGNFGTYGCLFSTPAVLGIAVVSAIWCGTICVEKGTKRTGAALQNS